MSRLGSITALGLAILLAGAAPRAARAEEARLTVLHTADLHGALTSWNYVSDRPAAAGLSRIATLVKRARAEGAPVLLLDAGDAIQGSPLEAIWHERGGRDGGGAEPMIAAMNRLGYDAMAIGNHEFSYGREFMRRARTESSFPWLAANLVDSTGAPAFAASVVRTAGPLRVGIVGITTPALPALEDSAHVAGVRLVPAVAAAKREVERLRGAEHCDVVILLAHTGYDAPGAAADLPDENIGGTLAREVPGVDLVILGHTHTVIPSLESGATLITQAGSRGERLGRVDLTLTRGSATDRWAVGARRASVIAIRDSVPADPDLEAAARPLHDLTRAALAETLGFATNPVAAPHGRLEDNALWELIQKVQLDASGADVSLAALPDPGVRLAGVIHRRDLMALYPYDNTLGIVELTGAELLATLERSAGYLAPRLYDWDGDAALTDSSVAAARFDAADGVGYEIDLTRPPGQRVVHLVFRGAPVTPEQRFKVVINSYRMNGGGGFETLRRAPRLWRAPLDVRSLIEAYVRKVHTLDGSFNRNWSLIPDYVAGPERASIDLLVRRNVLPRSEALRVYPSEVARRGDLAYWISRAFGWRERRLSGAFADVPDSLEPWLDGLIRRKVLGQAQGGETFMPFTPISVSLALDWCEGAARAAHYVLSSPLADPSFRRGLLAGVDLGGGAARPLGAHIYLDSLTRGQTLTMIANLRFPPIRVLETTDFHGFIQPGRERGTNRPIGGSVALASWLAALRAENPEGVVLVDGGDLFQGTMMSNLAFGRPIVEQMNALGYTAAAIGNHEFDWTADTLERRIGEMHFRDLGANMVMARGGKRPRWVGSDTTVVRHGVRVGVLGLCYPATPTVTLPANVAQFRFLDDSATAAARVPAMRKAGADVMVGVGHIPAETPQGRITGDLPRLARGVPGVDVWLGGHSHNRVIGDVNGIPLMIAGAHGEIVGVCDLRVDPIAHRVIERRARLVTVYGDTLAPDSAMVARVERWNQGVAAVAAKVIGRNATTLTRARDAESTLGNLITDAMRAEIGADIALQNSGGIRADLPDGDITMGRIYEVMPFDNTIVTMKLTGAEMKRVLEEGLKGGRVCQVSGIRYVFDSSRPPLDRVTKLTDTAGAPIDSARTYVVACNNFMAAGGDDYATLTQGRESKDTTVLVRDALERYVRQRCANDAVLDVRADGRVTRNGRNGSSSSN
jgi:2',3'-cyclic-nucleotide 2'-phosphodiesterase / 3'-nucleotidase / 5'-nucleotidase